ncbi:MAG: hypothetical protein RMJ00_03095 [Nitrososphaerota archaeon]|nr:hypothetical protein [Candidatus Bathyarchaeota archaeon]MDW8061664.1 hypothetical protein [Nitrososphaerota archaeon]
MRRLLSILIPLTLALTLRLYPTLSSGLPFSTDAWPILRNTELLSKLTPVDLGDEKVFDGYNSYWPANTIFGVILSRISGLDTIHSMSLGVPLSSALAIPIFYALLEALTGDRSLALTASIILASSYPYSILTAGVTKETYASPIYILLILVYLYRRGSLYARLILVALSSLALASAHHLTSIVSLTILSCISIAELYEWVVGGVYPRLERPVYTMVYAAILGLYFWLYAYRGVRIEISFGDIASAVSYQIVALTFSLYVYRRPILGYRMGAAALSTVAAMVTALAAFIPTVKQITPGLPRLPRYYIVYAIPFITASQIAVIGFRYTRRYTWRIIPLLWLSSIIGLEAYSIFGGHPIGSTLAYRMLNFLWPPLSILVASGLEAVYRSIYDAKSRSAAAKAAIAAYMIILVSSNLYDYYASINLRERYMGYFWLYTPYEYSSIRYLDSSIGELPISCDVKMSYLAGGYLGIDVDTIQGFRYLSGLSNVKPKTLLVYRDMLSIGYILYGGYSVYLGGSALGRLESLSMVYSNREAWIYVP